MNTCISREELECIYLAKDNYKELFELDCPWYKNDEYISLEFDKHGIKVISHDGVTPTLYYQYGWWVNVDGGERWNYIPTEIFEKHYILKENEERANGAVRKELRLRTETHRINLLLESDIITKEQAWDQISSLLSKELEEEYSEAKMREDIMKWHPEANKDVIDFIVTFNWHNGKFYDLQESIRSQFRAGYCYYFALMLKDAFERGTICWCAPFGHIVWVDDDGIPYDIEGVYDGEAEYYIPISYIQEGIADFKHVPGKEFGASEEYIDAAIERYKHNKDRKDQFEKIMASAKTDSEHRRAKYLRDYYEKKL